MHAEGDTPSIRLSCKLWVHDDSFSHHDVLFNFAAFPNASLSQGALLIAIPSGTGPEDGLTNDSSWLRQSGFVFLARDCDSEFKTKHANLQLSVSSKVAKLYGFKNLMDVSILDADLAAHSASHIEICFRDVYLTRADLQRLVAANLLNRSLFEGQVITFLGSVVRATVKSIYYRGHRVPAGYFDGHTKPIFRSESARYVLYIQMSREMWDFDTEGSGEIIFNKVVRSVLPELFRRWTDLNARHLVSVVLFTRLDTDPANISSDQSPPPNLLENGRDFYRVVVAEMYSGEWATILNELKKEFKQFLKDVLTTPTADSPYGNVSNRLTFAKDGNILEAINLASSRFAKDWIDPDLVRTGLTVIVITPGPGYFEVEETMLRLINENLVRSGVSIDLLCLSQPPLHRVPLFGFARTVSSRSADAPITDTGLDPEPNIPGESTSKLIYVIPQWIQIHFWSTSRNIARQKNTGKHNSFKSPIPMPITPFIPSCRMYEVQMTGIMENEMSDISIPYLHVDKMNLLEKARQRAQAQDFQHQHRASFHESPPKSIYLGSNFSKQTSQKPKIEQTSKTFDEEEWMDEYDNAVYAKPDPNPATAFSLGTIPYPSESNRSLSNTGAPPFSSSLISISVSPAVNTFSRPKHPIRPSLHMSSGVQDKEPHRETSLSRKLSKESMQSQPNSKNPPHLFPLGLSMKTSSKAIPTMQHAADIATSSLSVQRDISDSTDDTYSQKAGPVSRQIRESLLRNSPVSKIDKTPSLAPASAQHSTDGNVINTVNQELSANPKDSRPRSKHHTKQDSSSSLSSRYQPLSLAEPAPYSPNSLSPEQIFMLATSPWLTKCNPFRKGDEQTGFAAHHGWTHVFVRPNKKFGMHWKSLCSPALLPLASDYTISNDILKTYQESSHKVTLSDDELADVTTARARLVNSMISFRLGKGFQILPKPSTIFYHEPNSESIHLHNDLFTEDNITLYMSKGNIIHSIHVSGTEIQVTRYRPQDTSSHSNMTLLYTPLIKTTFANNYELRRLTLSAKPEGLNWSAIDNFLAGYPASLTNAIGFWRARFVLIPVGPPSNVRSRLPTLAEDSDDEIYIEGIQRLTQFWERARFNPGETQQLQSPYQPPPQKEPTPNPLNLEFQTRDASAVIIAGLDGSLLHEDRNLFPPSQLFSENELYNSGKVDLRKLAADLQSDKGIKMQDRRWYFRLHPNCFVGLDLTSWLLYQFQDIESREAAIQLGQSLMEKGLFKHVSGRHKFRDGNYFYQITAEFRIAKSDSKSGWFSWKPEKGSVPSTPHLEASAEFGNPAKSTTKVGRVESPMEALKSEQIPDSTKKRPSVRLSSMMQCDIDIRKKSDRPEIVDLHYDRLYNPDSCYHFRLEWMNTTAKLVEDAVANWSSQVERYGLRLVQVPLVEASKVTETNPYRSPYIVELAVLPPKTNQESHAETHSPATQSKFNMGTRPVYKALLRKLGFVLESEAASNFPADVQISYSWGHDVRYENTQYIHKTGVILAQITDDGKILLVANRLADIRATHPRDSGRFDKRGKRDEQSPWSTSGKDARPASSHIYRKSMLTSPALSAVTDNPWHPDDKYSYIPTAEQIKDEIEAFCQDESALNVFYEEVNAREPSHSTKPTPLLTATIPKLDLQSVTDLSLHELREPGKAPKELGGGHT